MPRFIMFLKRLPQAASVEEIEALLPWNVDTQTIAVN